MAIWLLEHIFYGMASLQYGGLTFQALPAGTLGESVSLTVVAGAELSVAVNTSNFNIAITITAPAGATERQVRQAVQLSADFVAVATVDQTSGDGTAVVQPLATTNFVAAGGMLQSLISQFNLPEWNDRDLKTTDAMQALLYPNFYDPTRQGPDVWRFEGQAQVGIAITNAYDFVIQNTLLQQLGRQLDALVRTFGAQNLDATWPIRVAFTNTMRDESAGQAKALETAMMRVVCTFGFRFHQPAILNPPTSPVLTDIQFGLFIQPDNTAPGSAGAELDTTLTIDQS